MLKGKEEQVEQGDDHEVHLAVHQEALGQGADEAILPHMRMHTQMMRQTPKFSPRGNGEIGGMGGEVVPPGPEMGFGQGQ